MLFRYGATDNGTIVKKAHIYTQEEHGIDPHLVDPDAMWVLRGLRKEGFAAYVVGGAVRDMIVGRAPNDFDVATDAHPQQISRVFRSARIIGRRFRIVHVYCGREKYIEVTTFRSRGAVGTSEHSAHPEQNNFFGTMEEDAERRDFTINALYYCPIDKLVIDYVGGVPDTASAPARPWCAAETSFAEDPVRMIRAVKYASLVGFPVPPAMAGFIADARIAPDLLAGAGDGRGVQDPFLRRGGRTSGPGSQAPPVRGDFSGSCRGPAPEQEEVRRSSLCGAAAGA